MNLNINIIIKFIEFIVFLLICYLLIIFNKNNSSFYKIYKEYFHKNKVFLKKFKRFTSKFEVKSLNLTSKKIFFICFITGIIFYILSKFIINVKYLNLIIGIIGMFFPFILIDFILEKREIEIRNNFMNMILQLKNYAEIENDVIFSFKSIQNDSFFPFDEYIKEFLGYVNRGVSITEGLENIKNKINFKIGKTFFDNICFCIIYGGDYKKMLSKTYKIMKDINEEQRNKKMEIKSASIILYIMIFLDFIVYFTYIKSNADYMNIIENSLIGNILILSNIISIVLVIWILSYVKKIEK